MKLSQSELKALHQFSFQNELLLRNAKQAGCFCCLEVFPTSAIEDWIQDQFCQTAYCPHCGVDSVLADDENIKLSHDLLKQLQSKYFCPIDEIREYRYFKSLAELMHARYTAEEENVDTTGTAFCLLV
jgi:hypothetical protein